MIWLILAVVLSALIHYYVVKPLSYWKDKGVVHRKPLPLVGNSGKLALKRIAFFDYIRQLYQEFSNERYFGTHQFTKPILFVNDLELIRRITVKDHESFLDHNNFAIEDVEPLIGKNLFNLKGQRWRDMRATLSPAFTSSKMKMMFSLVSECAEEFADHFVRKDKELLHVEMKNIFTKFTNDVIASVAFGYKCNSLEKPNNEFYTMGQKTVLGSAKVVLSGSCPRLAKFLKLRLLPSSVAIFFKRIVRETIHERETKKLLRPDMIHLLMEARKGELNDANGNDSQISEQKRKMELSLDDITSQALLFFLGGFDTSSILLTLIAYELALNKDVQKKLQDEIDDVLDNGKLTYETLNKMKYMDMVLSETLRKWPPGFLLDRLCVKDYLIEPVNSWEKPLLIEKGQVIQIPVIGIHRDPKYFPHPDKFDPERFSDENKHNIQSYSYMPFGSGPRICIASRFALMENKILMFYLLSKFDIVKTDKTIYPFKVSKNIFTIASDDGFRLGLQRRQTAS